MMHLLVLSSTFALTTFVGFGLAYPSDAANIVSRNPAPLVETSSLKEAANYASVTRVKGSGKGYGSAKFRDLQVEGEWALKINFGGQDLSVIVDTTRSNTWVAKKNFTCVNETMFEVPQADCLFGPLFDGTFPDGAIKDRNFRATGVFAPQFVYGEVGYENVTVAGIKVLNQEVALVDQAFYAGDGITSGRMGLGYRTLTSSYVGDNRTLDNDTVVGDQPGDRSLYTPIFETMIRDDLIGSPLFTLALERSNSTAYNTPGGAIAFGGLPPLSFDPVFTSTPIDIFLYEGDPSYEIGKPTYYSILPDGYVVANAAGAHIHYPTSVHAILDTGYPDLVVSTAAFNAYIAALPTSPTYNSTYGVYTVPCDTASPFFGVRINGTVFPIDGADIIENLTVGANPTVIACFIGVYGGADDVGGAATFGDPFLKNVVAVFDVGAGMMRFAQHTY